eukprot:760159-Hanusia_phi.AAC.3
MAGARGCSREPETSNNFIGLIVGLRTNNGPGTQRWAIANGGGIRLGDRGGGEEQGPALRGSGARGLALPTTVSGVEEGIRRPEFLSEELSGQTSGNWAASRPVWGSSLRNMGEAGLI